jgi:hypothetical protein
MNVVAVQHEQAGISHGMSKLRVHLLLTRCPAAVHWREKPSVRKIAMQSNSNDSESTIERTMAMNYKVWVPKTAWLGTIGFAAMLIGWTPSCKAQEVSPAIFTATGVEDVYPAQKPLPKKAAKVQTSAHANSILSDQANAEKRKTRRAVRKQNIVSAPSV